MNDMACASLQRKPIPADALRRLGVVAVYLFGSQAEGTAGAASDIDLGIVRAQPLRGQADAGELYQALYGIFTDVFDMSGFRDIDIAFLDSASLELRFDAISHGKVVFDDDAHARLDFEERTAALYRDFQPLREESDRAVLQRI